MPTTEQLKTAAEMTVQGASLRTIGEATGVSHVSVLQWKEKDEFNQLIKQAQTKLIKDSLLTAIENQSCKISAGQKICQKIQNEEKLSDGSVKLLELAHDAEGKLLQSVGIHPSHTQSIQINNILVDARSELSPAVEALLIQHISGNNADNCIDIEQGSK